MMKRFASTLTLAVILSQPAFPGENWPQFRGPDGQGHSDAKGLPLTWSETQNIKWKTPIHGKGWSSPVIWGSQIWVTTATEDAKQLFVVCVDRDTGKILHDTKLFDVETPQFIIKLNSPASPTPVIEEGRGYVTFGTPGTACLDTATGKVLSQRRDLQIDHVRGAGASPILFGNLLIVNFDGGDAQFVIAMDKATGKTVWKTNRTVDFKDLDKDGKPDRAGDRRKGFCTPLVASFGGAPILIDPGSMAFYAYDPLTGKELWRTEERKNHSVAVRQRVDLRLHRHGQGVGLGSPPRRPWRGDRHACRVEGPAQRADHAVAHSHGQPAVHGERQRHPHLPRRHDRRGGVGAENRWRFFGGAHLQRRPPLLL